MRFLLGRRFSPAGFLTLLLLFFCQGSAENWAEWKNPISSCGEPGRCLLDFYTAEAFDVARVLAFTPIASNDLELLELSQLIVDKSKEIGVDPFLVLAIIQVESTFDPCARSSRGAKGLMQVMPHRILGSSEVRREYAFSQHLFYDPHWNIDFGVNYLGYLLRRFGCLETALTAYNAGPTRVSVWLSEGDTAVATPYSARVFASYRTLKRGSRSADETKS